MTRWETIHDRSSHISPVRLVQTKNYSTERGNGMFEAVSKSFIPTKTSLSQQHSIKKPKSKFNKSIVLKFTLSLLLLCLPIILLWPCYTQEDSICHRVDRNLYTRQIEHLKRTIQSHVTRPFSDRQQVWVDRARQSVYTPSRMIQDYYKTTIYPIITSNEKTIKKHWSLWKREYDIYVNQKKDYTTTDTVIENKLELTAEWIREYIQPNILSPRAVMRKEDAEEKAQEIVRGIKRAENN